MPSPTMTTAEVGKLLKRDAKWVAEKCRTQRLRAMRIDGVGPWVISRASVEEFLGPLGLSEPKAVDDRPSRRALENVRRVRARYGYAQPEDSPKPTLTEADRRRAARKRAMRGWPQPDATRGRRPGGKPKPPEDSS